MVRLIRRPFVTAECAAGNQPTQCDPSVLGLICFK